MTTDEEPVARPGHVSTLDIDAIERRLAAVDETITAAQERLDAADDPPDDEPEPMLSLESAQRLAAVNARAKLALGAGRPANRPSLG